MRPRQIASTAGGMSGTRLRGATISAVSAFASVAIELPPSKGRFLKTVVPWLKQK